MNTIVPNPELGRTLATLATLALAALACDPGYDLADEAVAPSGPSWEQILSAAIEDPDTGHLTLEGDMIFESEAALRRFWLGAKSLSSVGRETEDLPPGFGRSTSALLLHDPPASRGGGRWPLRFARDLSYCVSNGFEGNKATVVRAMKDAAAEWQSHANLYFRHVPSEDATCVRSTAAVRFAVLRDDGIDARASSFVGNENSNGQGTNRLLIQNSATTSDYGVLVALLKHELGHVLGFLHEHARTGLCGEHVTEPVVTLTPYDPDSIMHYRDCRGPLEPIGLSLQDKNGVRRVYGPPPSLGSDPAGYLLRYPDLLAAYTERGFVPAAQHWLSFGVREGRRGALEFDAQYYLRQHGDLRAAFGPTNYAAALDHWLRFGIAEGRQADDTFDVNFYLGHHPDLAHLLRTRDYRAGVEHWLVFGINEGRRGSRGFDVAAYLRNHSDLREAFGPTNYAAALDHWISTGRHEPGRRPLP